MRFRRLGLDGQVLHRLISPSIAYFLLVAGLALLVFEFYTAGVGLAGLVGALCVVGAFVGFSHLPVHWWAFALLLFATFGFAIDVQVGSVGVWTVIGDGRARRGLAVPVRRLLGAATGVVGAARGVRGDDPVHGGRHDGDDPLAVLHAHDRARGDDR